MTARRTAVWVRDLLGLLGLIGVAGCGGYEGLTQAEIGQKVYESQCAVCHQASGRGVPDLQPALAGSAIVLGDPAILIEVITLGSSAPFLEDRLEGAPLGNAMAGFSHLSDQELAAVASFIRSRFGNQAPALSDEDVAQWRER